MQGKVFEILRNSFTELSDSRLFIRYTRILRRYARRHEDLFLENLINLQTSCSRRIVSSDFTWKRATICIKVKT